METIKEIDNKIYELQTQLNELEYKKKCINNQITDYTGKYYKIVQEYITFFIKVKEQNVHYSSLLLRGPSICVNDNWIDFVKHETVYIDPNDNITEITEEAFKALLNKYLEKSKQYMLDEC